MNTRIGSIVLFGIMVTAGSLVYACSDDEPATGGTSSGSSGTSGGSSGTSGSSGSSGTSGGAATALRAKATIAPTSADGGVKGSVDFVEENGTTTVTAAITEGGGRAGKHGLHIHANPNCDAVDGGAGLGAGGHWNPEDAGHGSPDGPSHHLGDLGNITIDEAGKGTLTLTTNKFTVKEGPKSVVGHSVVYHLGEDDLVSQPVGDAGARPGCGIITKQ